MPKTTEQTEQAKTTVADREAAGRAKVAAQSTELLCLSFLLTEAKAGRDRAVSMVRGWIMDELETRDPEAFGAWMDDFDSPLPHSFYGVALVG